MGIERMNDSQGKDEENESMRETGGKHRSERKPSGELAVRDRDLV